MLLWTTQNQAESEDSITNLGIYIPSGYVKIAIENTTFIVDLPIKNGDCP